MQIFLMNGTSDDLVKNTLTDIELINQFKTIEFMDNHDKDVIKTLFEAIITKDKIRKMFL